MNKSPQIWLQRDHRKSKSAISIEWKFLFAPKLKAFKYRPLSLESYGRRRQRNRSVVKQGEKLKKIRNLLTFEEESLWKRTDEYALKKGCNCPLQMYIDDQSQFQFVI